MFLAMATGQPAPKLDKAVRRRGQPKSVIRKRLMTQQEVEEWVRTAVQSGEETGRCKAEPRFTFKLLKKDGAVRETAPEQARVHESVHRAACATQTIPAALMAAATALSARLPKAARPVEFAGSMGFKAALLTELHSARADADAETEAAAAAVEAAFPFGDIDLAVHVESEAETAVAQATIDNVVCDVKTTLDRLLWGPSCPSAMRELDLGEDYVSPFAEEAKCSMNCCLILPVDEDAAVRVDVPTLPGVERRMRFSPLCVTRNTSIRAGFTLTRLLLGVRKADGGRVMVPLLDISMSVGPKRKCCPTTLFGVKVMAASAKAVHRHLDDLVADGDPAKREKRVLQQQAARQARQAFMRVTTHRAR